MKISTVIILSLIISMTVAPNLVTSFAQAKKYTPPLDPSITAVNTPIVSTRGHTQEYDTANPLQMRDPWLTNPKNTLGYDTTRNIPGLDDKTQPKEIIIYVHGWNNNEKEAVHNFNLFDNALWKKSDNFPKPVIGFSWDSNTGVADYDDAKEIAQLNGPKLAQFILDYHSKSENTKIRLVGHSLGTQVILNTIQSLYDNPKSVDKIITSVDFVGASVDNEAVSMDRGNFGQAITTVVGELNNYYNYNDPFLSAGYFAEENDQALGEDGAEKGITRPPNYHQYDVTAKVGRSHSNYNEVIPDIVNEWRVSDSKKVEKKPDVDEKKLGELLDKGLSLENEGKHEEALPYYKKALEIELDNVFALSGVGSILVGLGQDEEALPYFKKSLEIEPKQGTTLWLMGVALENLGKHEEAIKYYKKALEIEPNHADILHSTGAAMLFNLNKYEEAIKYYKKALEIEPNDETALINIGAALENLGKHEEAIKYYKKALEIEPNDADTLELMGAALEGLGQYKEAAKYYDKALKIDPDNLFYQDLRSRVNDKLKQVAESKKVEKETKQETKVEKKPDVDDTKFKELFDKGASLANDGQYEKALSYYKKALEIEPKNESVLIDIGYTLFTLDRYEEALKYFKKALEIEPKNESILFGMGVALENLGKHEEALKYFKKALEIEPNRADTLFNVGLSLANLGKHEEAIKYYERSLKIAPNRADTLSSIGSALGNLGKYKEAAKYFDRALKIDPDHKIAQQNKKLANDKINGSLIIHVTSGKCTVNQKCKILIATAIGGSPKYSFRSDTFANGSPPQGMIVDLNGYLTGTPSREGTYNVGVCVVDSVGKSDCGQVTVIINQSTEEKSSGIRYCLSNVFHPEKLACGPNDYDGKWKDTMISGKMRYCIVSSEYDWKCK